jgi:predicted MFS family arabinose efflux permease
VNARFSLLLCGILFLLGWALVALSEAVPVLFAGRIITVMSAGAMAVTIGRHYIEVQGSML